MARAGVTRARAALLLPLFLLGTPLLLPSLARAQIVGPPTPPRHGVAVMLVVDGLSFEDAMAIPSFGRLARGGGSALMTTKAGTGDSGRAAYLTIAAGARTPGAGSRAYLPFVLESAGVRSCLALGSGSPDTARPATLIAGVGPHAPLSCDLGPITAVPAVLRAGSKDMLVVVDVNGYRLCSGCVERTQDALGRAIADLVTGSGASRALVMVVSPTTSAEMDRAGDEVTAAFLAEGSPATLFRPTGAFHALRSDTTRRSGLVSNVDVAPTILQFFGIPIPSEMDGSPIETVNAAAPFALHRLHLEQRRIRLPVQLAEVAYVAGLGIVGIIALVVLAVRGSLPKRFAAFMRFATLVGVAEGVTLLAGGLLPRLTYAWVVPYLVITMPALAALSLTARSRGPLGPFTFLAAVGLGFVLLDGVLGGYAFRVPLLGGTMFDGARFYGLPNAFIAVPLSGALFLAAGLDAFQGFLLLIGVGLFCGFPGLGANVGAAITLFTASGVWWVVRTRPRIGIRELAFVAGVTALGTAGVLIANRIAPGTPTHVGRFVERSGGSLHRAATDLGHRLGIGLGQIRRAPAALIPLTGLVVVLVLAIRPVGPIRAGLGLVGNRWQQMIAALSIASLVAFVANDTGVAAAAPGFLYALTALAYPAYLTETGWGPGRVGRGGPAETKVEAGGSPAVNSPGPRAGNGSMPE